VRVAFFGLPLAALLLARDRHDIVWAGVCRRGAIGTRRLMRLATGPVRVGPGACDDDGIRELRRARPDLLVSWFWTKKLPPAALRIGPAFGVHPSLLPRHRGADPYFWAIDSGDETTGVTAHRLDDEYDTGPILAQRSIRIDPSWDAWTLARELDRPSLRLMRDVVGAFATGRLPEARGQDERLATLAPTPTEDDLAIRWSWPAARVERRVRASSPWPGAWTEVGGQIVTLVRARVTDEYPRVLLPGEAAVRPDGVAVVRAGDRAVELLAGRREDDSPLHVPDFATIVMAARPLSIAREAGLRFDA
jgi:methionyl-tRNA formyltransferase